MNIVQSSRIWDHGIYISGLFADYLKNCGHNVIDVGEDQNIPDIFKIHFAFGWGTNSILKQLRDDFKIPTFSFDLGMIHRTEVPKNENGYFRFGFGDATWINYDKSTDTTRWNTLNIPFKNEMCHNGIIAFMGQVPTDVSHGMSETELYTWTINTIQKIQNMHPNNQIVYKCHPLATTHPTQILLTEELKRMGIVVDTTQTRIEKCNVENTYRAVFTICSTSAIHFIINGIPVICAKNAMFYPLATDINGSWNIDFIPSISEKTSWFSAMAYSQWTQTEIKNGTMWNHMKHLVPTA